MNYEAIIDSILKIEDGYVDHPDDRGGPTNYGITQAVARANGWTGPMQELPLTLARMIYMKRYITEPHFDQVATVNSKVGFELIDTGINMGPARAAEFFQRCLNVFNLQGSRYADVFVDGRIGPVTLEAFRAFMRWRGEAGERTFLKALNCVQGTRYIEIAENDARQESFIFGWLTHRVEI